MSKPRLPSIPAPHDLPSTSSSVRAIKEILDFFMGRTKADKLGTVVTYQDLVDMGLVTEIEARAQIGRP